MNSRIFYLLIACFTLHFTSFAQETPAIRIVCLGDSLTAGYGVNENQAWPALLQKQLDEIKSPALVINAGTSGNTSAGGLRKLPWLFKKRVDILILALGANDGLRGLNTEDTRDNLEKTILLARKKNPNIKILIAGMKVPPNMGSDYSQRFEKLFSELSQKHKCSLIPFLLEGVGGVKEFNLADGIHPNPKGHKTISKTVLMSVKDLL